MGSLTSFAIVAGSAVTATGTCVVNGDVALTAGTSDGSTGVIGTHYVKTTAEAIQAKKDLVAAKSTASGATSSTGYSTPVPIDADITASREFVPGVYSYSPALAISADLTITLNGNGVSNPFWIFNFASDLNVRARVHFDLTNGATSSQVWWNVGGITALEANVNIVGTIMSQTSVTVGNLAVTGSLFAVDAE
eukprot:gene4101-5236_t